MLATGLLISLISGLAALAVTALIRRHADRLGVVAAPNERSSHTQPTPSGGGVGIVAGGTLGALFVATQGPWPASLIVMASLIVAAVGFIDDRRPLRAVWRLGTQLGLVALVVIAGLPFAALHTGLGLPLPLVLAVALAILGSVYWINLFNFMDGIDGLAATQAIFMLGAAALLALLQVPMVATAPEFWWLPALAAAAGGFLLLNWPPAKIFMGDAGSTYLGFLLAMLALFTIALGWLSLWQWLILAAVFATDATVTLVRRLLLRERVFEAHRRHAYQVLSRRWRSHRKVTCAVLATNLLWLLPLAALAGTFAALGLVLTLLAYLPLLALALWLGAGAPEARA